ncbi:MAG: hypothetical protein KKI09_09960 [Spirochaetes bacterium]|nr:hypothetical protein [Spirochaetota bacterium]MBU0955740.1 hypothetical protein [Spirochaetota bacterium]
MKAFLLKLLLVLVLAAGTVAVVLYLTGDWQEKKIVSLETAIAGLQEEYVPLRFMVVSRDPASITLRVRLYNLAGTELGMVETSLPGKELSIDFLVVPLHQSWAVFPVRIFTDAMAAETGITLDSIVAPAGLPLTYAGGSFDEEQLAELGKLYTSLLAGENVPGAYGNAVHDVKELRRFELGQVYRIVVRKKGGIEILEDS